MSSEITRSLQSVPDDELLRSLAELVSRSRRVEADLVAHIGEVDERRLYARQAFPSMFAYCTEHLHLSEAEAYRRITVARAARLYPTLLDRLRDGRVQLSGLARLVPHLTADNFAAVLGRATRRTTRQIEALIAELSPKADVPASIRKLPQIRPVAPVPVPAGDLEPPPMSGDLATGRIEAASTTPDELVARRVETVPLLAAMAAPAPASRARLEPLAPARFKVQFTASAELRDKLERLQALMRSEIPDGDLATVIEHAISEKLARLEARRFGKTKAPRAKLADADTSGASRHIPAAVRRAVSDRDGDRCRFVDGNGRRCSERRWLEFHHRHPYAAGGDHGLANVSLLCRQHNRQMAEQDYGRGKVRSIASPETLPPIRER
jgi:5-methylcytosine-specific restriction endonuclease McrA